MTSIIRFKENPIVTPQSIQPSREDMIVEGVLNPGAFIFQDKTYLLLRVAERPKQEDGIVSFPVMGDENTIDILKFNKDDPQLDLSDPRIVKKANTFYLTTMSHLRLMESADGIHFTTPSTLPSIIYPTKAAEKYGMEDCRVTVIDDVYYLTYTQVSAGGVCVGMMSTSDWIHFEHLGTILPPHNKDCALFPQKVGGKYFCLHRPSGVDLGGNYVWISESNDLVHWGKHNCLAMTRKDHWDSNRIGAGASPIWTKDGWLVIYHGANHTNRYCLGAILLDLQDPKQILARSEDPIMEPDELYEQNGFFGEVVFTNGHVQFGDQLWMYYGASDSVVCGAHLSIKSILKSLE